jgi:hypothetical protein
MDKIVLLLCVTWLITGCKNDKIPDISNINADVKIFRTEMEINKIKDHKQLEELIASHPSFYNLYLNEILPIYKGNNKDSILMSFNFFVKDSVVNDLTKKVIAKYQNTDDLKKEIDQMYKFLQYYFPNKASIPNIYTFVSDFGYQIFIFEDDGKKDGIAIGLDMFMHPDVDYKMINPDNTNFSDYITRSWNQDHIVKKIADIYVADIVGETPGHRMLDQMIHNGKALYLTDLLLPLAHDSIIHEYSDKQLKWCQENELQMWSFFFDQKLFYESNPMKIAKFIFPSPKSPDMPDDAPGRTANFIGWQIVKAYMDRYPETSINELIKITDSQMIMEKSKYKPKQK